MKTGIAFAGNLIVDHIKTIETLPKRSELARISSQVDSTGGCVCNTGIDMAQLDASVPLSAYGVVGNDADGELIIARLRAYGIETAGIRRFGSTSYTDVYAETATSCRTFFQFGGANDVMDIDDVLPGALNARILHLGYLLLLERLDAPDAAFGTRSARLLYEARKQGLLTSVDVVSDNAERFASVVLPALPYVDYLSMNELEAERVTGVCLTDENGRLIAEKAREALCVLLAAGVSRWAIIHAADGAYGMDRSGSCWFEPSKRLPPGYIRGTVGAGDAFCAGALLAAYRGGSVREALRFGNASALVSLRADTATDGVCPIDKALQLYDSDISCLTDL